MIANRELIADVRRHVKLCSPDRRAAVEGMITEYQIACRLSCGSLPDRSIHWEYLAQERRYELTRIVGTWQVDDEEFDCKGR